MHALEQNPQSKGFPDNKRSNKNNNNENKKQSENSLKSPAIFYLFSD